jgi:hypothetical protein
MVILLALFLRHQANRTGARLLLCWIQRKVALNQWEPETYLTSSMMKNLEAIPTKVNTPIAPALQTTSILRLERNPCHRSEKKKKDFPMKTKPNLANYFKKASILHSSTNGANPLHHAAQQSQKWDATAAD